MPPLARLHLATLLTDCCAVLPPFLLEVGGLVAHSSVRSRCPVVPAYRPFCSLCAAFVGAHGARSGVRGQQLCRYDCLTALFLPVTS